MKMDGEGLLLRIIVGENERYDGQPLYLAVVETAREKGLAGATVYRGIAGYGGENRLHTSKVLRLAENLPVIIDIVDLTEYIEDALDTFDEMVGPEGLITIQSIEIVGYQTDDEADEDDDDLDDDEEDDEDEDDDDGEEEDEDEGEDDDDDEFDEDEYEDEDEDDN